MLAELHEQELKTIVPLVESASSVASLWQLGAHFIQGYYVQAPQAGMVYDFSDDDE
jgi:EAL domain-containing protein (putative c-di-GMP-specific phosphodiesterase class I)